MTSKTIVEVRAAGPRHWVGDGFPVTTLFGYHDLGAEAASPFLMLDHAAPMAFAPGTQRRGVGEHPHRGFETVTVVLSGEIEHRDSAGGGGRIGPGDVQWMTAGDGVVHDEFHSEAFTRTGGLLHMVQLWVNLPARDKRTKPRYQTLRDIAMPRASLAEGAAVRVIAGRCAGVDGAARTFTQVDLWDVTLAPGARAVLPLVDGHTALLVVLEGALGGVDSPSGGAAVGTLVVATRAGADWTIVAGADGARVLVLGGAPLGEPVAAYGPFVMNTRDELVEAFRDFEAGRMGTLSPVTEATS
jgi:redox-sensitive bicupin YhaK (pirin superfamily)